MNRSLTAKVTRTLVKAHSLVTQGLSLLGVELIIDSVFQSSILG